MGAAEPTPKGVVESFQGHLLSVMKEARVLDVKGRYERLRAPVENSFHLGLITQVVSGSFWKVASKEQKQRLVAALTEMSLATLATLFDDYSGQVFATVGEKQGPQDTRVVETRLVDTDGSDVDLAYVTKSFKDGWRIVDVVVDNGISELATRRSEYHRLLSSEGVEGLISALNAKAAELFTAKP